MPAEIKFCHCCRQGQLQIISDFSKQARCIDFRHSLTESPESIIKFDFAIAQCDTCGLIQLLQPIDYQSMLTEFDWINNKEPVQHHTWMAKDILQILGNDENVLFLSKYDQKIFDLVSQKIGKRAFILDSTKDLLIDSDNPQQAQIQNKITPEIFSVLCSRYGHFDLIVSCRLLEHAHNSYGFMNALRFLLKPQGRIIIEVPESTKALLQGDISMLWEEHISYFTTESLKSSFLHLGLQFERSWLYPYPQEDAIAALFSDIKQEVRSIFPAVSGEQNLALNYLHKISVLKQKIQFELMHFQKQYGDIVIFGAGHRSIMFVNLLGISSYIRFVIDDDTNKLNLLLPGTDIKIINSTLLSQYKPKVCLLAVGLHIEEKIVQKLNQINSGIEHFFSISPDSQNALAIFSSSDT